MRSIWPDMRDRHDARDDRHLDPGGARAAEEVEVARVVEEQLRDQEVDAGVHLLDEVLEVGLGAARRGCGSRESRRRRSRTGSSPAISSTSSREYSRPALGLPPRLLAGRRVAAQREHVVDPGALASRRASSRSCATVAPTHVKCAIASSPYSLPDALDDLDRLLARRAAGAVGDRHERRLERRAARRAPRTRLRSPASVFGGKNSNENTGPSPARI